MRTSIRSRHLLVGLVLTIWVPLGPALAQDSGPSAGRFVLRGIVRSPSDIPVASAQVREIGQDHWATADGAGAFSLAGLQSGLQIIEVLARGYPPRRVQVAMSDSTPVVTIRLAMSAIMLDSVHVEAPHADVLARRADRITEAELADPWIAGGNSFDALAMLRPRLLVPRLPTGMTAKNESAVRAQLYTGDKADKYHLGTGAGSMSVSVNEGRPQSIDVLTIIPARMVKEMRYLRPTEATARFGIITGSGPVLIVYTR